MSDIKSFLNEASTAHQQLSKEARRMADKWEGSGLLEGLDGHERNGMAVLLENQAGQLLNEASSTGNENWEGVALPLVRKVLGQIASKNFVSVQPMNLPAGLVFFMDFQYGTAQSDRTSGESVYGVTSGSGTLPRDGLYGAGRFGYSSKKQTTTDPSDAAATTASAADLDFETTSSGTVYGIYRIPQSDFTRPDLVGVRSFVPSGSGVDFGATWLPQFTKVSGSNINFVAPLGGTIAAVDYNQQPTNAERGDFEDTDGSDISIPELNLSLRSETIAAKTRKLKAVWSPELAQDLNAYHSIDAEAELTAMLSDHISLEIDLEILDMLIGDATTTDYWSAQVGSVYDSATGAFTNVNTGTAWTNMTWFQTLGQKMQKVSNRIHQLTLRGGANFAVCSPTVATILETIPGFMAGTNGDRQEFAAGVTQVGSFQNRYTIYKNPYMTENVVLMGFRGSNFLETGAVYAPYIPLIMTPLVYDPTNFTPRRGVMTRYAKKVVRPEFFGKIVIDRLELI
tara:strand:- start:6969 stop:8501 length:1533 start_codon:yes stop_codon:yes gene_type:complete